MPNVQLFFALILAFKIILSSHVSWKYNALGDELHVAYVPYKPLFLAVEDFLTFRADAFHVV